MLRYLAYMMRSQLRTPSKRPSRASLATPKRRHVQRARKPAEYRGGVWGYAVAERLRSLMGGASVRKFAAEAEVSGSLVSSYLNGKRLPEAETLHKIAKSTRVSLDWLICGDGGTDVRLRGQSRARSELAVDVATYVRRGVSRRLADSHPNLAPEIDGQRVLDLVVRLTARGYRGYADRIAALAEATMPVTELALYTQDLVETLAPEMSPLGASELRHRSEGCVERALVAVESLPGKIAAAARHRPNVFFPAPTSADFTGIIERRSQAVMHPWVPPEERAVVPKTDSKQNRRTGGKAQGAKSGGGQSTG